NSGTLVFGIFNGVGASRIDVFDGLILIPGFDMGRSPTSTAMICERVGDLTGDPAADDARWNELARLSPIAPEGSISQEIKDHLARDFGPSQVALGGDWLLNMSLARTMTRGPIYED